MHKWKLWAAGFACFGLFSVAGNYTDIIAGENKEIPDHSAFKTCQDCHPEKYSMWEKSGHSKAISRVAENKQASTDCYGCHSTEGFAAKREGRKIDLQNKESYHTISCLACHNPNGVEYPYKLVMDPEKLCEVCHMQRTVLKGQGAKGIEDVRNVHSAVPCVSCHMTEGNHSMKVLRPDDPDLPETRLDTCTACHKDGNREARAKQLRDWQEWYEETMNPLKKDLESVNAELQQKPDRLNAELKSKLDDLKANLSIIERDRSNGAHNLDFALEIMASASKDLKKIKAALK